MGLQIGSPAATAGVCADCGASVSGNFCSSCGADLRGGALGLLGAATSTPRSFPAVYWRLLRSPVKGTVAVAEDPAYRSHVAFLLSGIAVFCLLFVPILLKSTMPTGTAQVSESMQTLMKVLSQVGVYVGAAITFFIAFGLYRLFAKEPRTLRAYFKLYCLAFGFVMPLYAAYEFLARGVLGGVGMSSLGEVTQPEHLAAPVTLVSLTLVLLLWAYFIAIHRRFWRMSVWRAGALYVVAALSSYQISFWLMYVVGYVVAAQLISAGVVKV